MFSIMSILPFVLILPQLLKITEQCSCHRLSLHSQPRLQMGQQLALAAAHKSALAVPSRQAGGAGWEWTTVLAPQACPHSRCHKSRLLGLLYLDSRPHPQLWLLGMLHNLQRVEPELACYHCCGPPHRRQPPWLPPTLLASTRSLALLV